MKFAQKAWLCTFCNSVIFSHSLVAARIRANDYWCSSRNEFLLLHGDDKSTRPTSFHMTHALRFNSARELVFVHRGATAEKCEYCSAMSHLRYWVRRQTLARVLVCSAMQLGEPTDGWRESCWDMFPCDLARCSHNPAYEATQRRTFCTITAQILRGAHTRSDSHNIIIIIIRSEITQCSHCSVYAYTHIEDAASNDFSYQLNSGGEILRETYKSIQKVSSTWLFWRGKSRNVL